MSRLVSTDYGGWIALAAGSCRGLGAAIESPPILSVSLYFCLEANAMNQANPSKIVVCKGFGEPLRPTCTSLYVYSICQVSWTHGGARLAIAGRHCSSIVKHSSGLQGGHQASGIGLISEVENHGAGCPCCPAVLDC